MTDDFFGELYLESTKPFLFEHVNDAEADFLRAQLPEHGTIFDLGCGHGRHLRRLANRAIVGLDGDPRSLVEAKQFAPVVRGDFRALPFRDGCFSGAYCWYNTLGTFEDEVAQQILLDLGRCLEPGAMLVLQGSHPLRAREQPEASYDGPLPGTGHLVEKTRYDPARKRDEITRELRLADGRVMAATFFLRYYDLDEWRQMLARAGLSVAWSHGGVDGSPLTDASADLIVGAKKRG